MAKRRLFVWDRESRRELEEPPWGEGALAWFYPECPLGALKRGLRAVLTHVELPSKLCGWWFSRAHSRALIDPFCQQFGVQKGDFVEPEGGYRSFNEFFQRKVRPEVRPLAGDERTIICPSDGRVRVYAHAPETLRVKGRAVTLPDLLGCDQASRLRGGSMVLIRLCPFDYHRFHYPTKGRLCERVPVKGALWSVHPWAEKSIPDVWWRNRRESEWIETPFGPYAYAAIGATGVGAIIETSAVGDEVTRGGERGRFALGGSALALFFPPDAVEWDQDLVDATAAGREVYCRLGSSLGHWKEDIL